MQILSSPIETVLSNKITINKIVRSFKDSPKKPLRRRPRVAWWASTSSNGCLRPLGQNGTDKQNSSGAITKIGIQLRAVDF